MVWLRALTRVGGALLLLLLELGTGLLGAATGGFRGGSFASAGQIGLLEAVFGVPAVVAFQDFAVLLGRVVGTRALLRLRTIGPELGARCFAEPAGGSGRADEIAKFLDVLRQAVEVFLDAAEAGVSVAGLRRI